MNTNTLFDGLAWYVAFVFSTTLHEAAHAFSALKLGDKTAYDGGQVTMDPIPHMKREPIGMIFVPIVSFLLGGWMIGWASAPYNYQWSLNYPKKAAKMALAGPLSNLLLVLIMGAVIRIGIEYEFLVSPEKINFTEVVGTYEEGWITTIVMFINVFFSLNILLFVFNLLPIPPLDGSAIIPFFLSDEKARIYLAFINNPSLTFFGIMIAWNVFDTIYDPIHLAVVNFLYIGIAHYS